MGSEAPATGSRAFDRPRRRTGITETGSVRASPKPFASSPHSEYEYSLPDHGSECMDDGIFSSDMILKYR